MIPRLTWPVDRQTIARTLWVEGKSGSEIAEAIGNGVTRSAVIGFISREGERIRQATGTNPYKRPDIGRNQWAGRPRVIREPRLPKPPKIAKPPRVARVIDLATITPGDRLPPLVGLDSRLWISLPNTTPKDLLSLGSCDCRWPLSTPVHLPVEEPGATLFCGANQADNSSYCTTHTYWSRSQKKLAPLNFGKAA